MYRQYLKINFLIFSFPIKIIWFQKENNLYDFKRKIIWNFFVDKYTHSVWRSILYFSILLYFFYMHHLFPIKIYPANYSLKDMNIIK